MTGARARGRGARAAAAALATLLVAVAPPARAASLGEIRAQAQSVSIAPGSGGPGEEAAIERLGRLALAFLDAADAGGDGAIGAYEAISKPLERSYEANKAVLDAMAKGVIDADGDMDALFATPGYQQHQALASQALYYLNWLNYRGAQLYGGAKRRELLEKAANGFGEFATAKSDNPVVIESRLGRGLTQLELDHPEWAVDDFEAVVDTKGASPDRVRKAQLALAEAYVKMGRSADALAASKAAVAGATPVDRPRAEFTRARALLMAAASQPAQRAAYRAEAQSLLAGLQAAGGPWGQRAASVARMAPDDPRIWAGTGKPKAPEPPPPSEWDTTKKLFVGGKYKEVIPRVDQVIASDDPEAREHRREAQYFLGVARFNTGDPKAAIAALDAALAGDGKAYFLDDAAYLRFKANESLYLADPTPERQAAYEEAIASFTRGFPGHKAVPEAHFRAGELRQREERYPDAIAAYAKVKGDPAFELRASFASAQSAVKLLEQAPDGKAPDPALRAQALAALERFEALAGEGDPKRFGDTPVADLQGQAALMHAYLVALATPPDYARAVALLEGFEEKYPKIAAQEEPQVVKLRLAAYARLGDLQALAREAERPAVAELEPALLDDVATRIITIAAREEASGHPETAAAGRRAARLLAERALASPEAAELPPPTVRRLQATLAALYEQQGEPEKALALYRAVLAREPDAVSARAGAARILESQGKVAEARALWDEVVTAPQGKSGWLEAHYQSARLSVALGDASRACTVLKEVPQSMLVGSNAETPRKIQDLLRTSCRG